jgi:hypothetical protein
MTELDGAAYDPEVVAAAADLPPSDVLDGDFEDRLFRMLYEQAAIVAPDEDDPTVKDWESYYDAKAELGEAALGMLAEIRRGRALRMNDVADLVAAARSKNDHQLSVHEVASLRHAERILTRMSGAYTVPKTFHRFWKLAEEES